MIWVFSVFCDSCLKSDCRLHLVSLMYQFILQIRRVNLSKWRWPRTDNTTALRFPSFPQRPTMLMFLQRCIFACQSPTNKHSLCEDSVLTSPRWGKNPPDGGDTFESSDINLILSDMCLQCWSQGNAFGYRWIEVLLIKDPTFIAHFFLMMTPCVLFVKLMSLVISGWCVLAVLVTFGNQNAPQGR